jgi:hypothetical protein
VLKHPTDFPISFHQLQFIHTPEIRSYPDEGFDERAVLRVWALPSKKINAVKIIAVVCGIATGKSGEAPTDALKASPTVRVAHRLLLGVHATDALRYQVTASRATNQVNNFRLGMPEERILHREFDAN